MVHQLHRAGHVMIDRTVALRNSVGGLARFSPGYFSLVMATGILSIASQFFGFLWIARVLFAVNLVAYLTIWGVQLARLFHYPWLTWRDLLSHERGASFLTVVAASALLGSQCHLLLGADSIALGLWLFAIGLWILLLNFWFSAVVLLDPKPSLDRGIDGSWLMLTVSTESLAILGTFVAGQFPDIDQGIFVCLAFYMLGAMFYLWIIGLVLLRWLFFPMDRCNAFRPTYWINSGAMAITTLAGARLIVTTSPHVESLAHFLTAFNLLFWATATWWIPLLFVMEAWRLFVGRVPFRYEPGYWSMVFPLGMYAACTWAYAESSDLPFLKPIAGVGIGLAWVAWMCTALGTLHAFFRWMKYRKTV